MPKPAVALRTHDRDTERRAQALPSNGRGPSQMRRIYAVLREEIVRGKLEPGQVMIEPELAARFAVSKTPVREALQVLVVEGLVTSIPRRGYVVRQLGINDVREILDLRLIIEPAMTAAAVRNTSPGFVDELRDIFTVQRSQHDTTELTDSARAFHERIIDQARNSRAQQTLGSLFDETTRMHFLLPAVSANIRSELELHGHQRILEAVMAGDVDAASAAMHEHLTETKSKILQAFLDG